MKQVLLLLAKGYETYEASVFIDVIGWNFVDGDHSTQLTTCGLTREVVSSFNQRCVVDRICEEIDVSTFDALALPGGFEEYGFYQDAYNIAFLNLIREFRRQGKVIASVCVGALPLGKSGVLSGHTGTTYNQTAERQAALRAFGVNVVNKPIVDDTHLITSWNPSTAIDVALLLLEKLTSRTNAEHIRQIMGFGARG